MNDYGRNAMHHGPGYTIPSKARFIALNLYIVALAMIGQPDANEYNPLALWPRDIGGEEV